MAKPYSEDLRRRVVERIEAGAIIPDAAEQCGVSISSVVCFLELHRDTGSVGAAKFGGYKEFALVAHEELVRGLIEDQPDITLEELKVRLAKKKVLARSPAWTACVTSAVNAINFGSSRDGFTDVCRFLKCSAIWVS